MFFNGIFAWHFYCTWGSNDSSVYNWSDSGTLYGAMLSWMHSDGYEYFADGAICGLNGLYDQAWIDKSSIVQGLEMDEVKKIIDLSFEDWKLADQKMSEYVQTKAINQNG